AGGVVYCDGKVLAIRAVPQNEVAFPKGTIETGETPEETAVREIFEETGYESVIKAPIGITEYEFDEDGKHFHKTVYQYLFELVDKNKQPTPHREEGEDFENLWLSFNEAFNELTHENSKNILRAAIDLINDVTP
ncbi:MAG TPA: NUDIX domain-containing protein, partial [Candidatus Saccharimonadales bacterium]|nr:NUDIX domain-containing protein [Candidatus Saccharimonadales bacterium]